MARIETESASGARNDWVTINVGGKIFMTTSYGSDNAVFEGVEFDVGENVYTGRSAQDSSGAYLIDRSPRYFEAILNYLRYGKLILDVNVNLQALLEESNFYGLTKLSDIIKDKIEQNIPIDDHSPLTRREVVNILMHVPFNENYQLRFQGVNFEGCDLSSLDLRNTNFKYANLHKANLTNTNLSFCNLERANLSEAIMDGASLLGVKMLCANLDGASMRSCNFEDPHQSKAILEGASLKGANLESSHMSGVNLRVASLKNAILRNCDLKSAVLAGADLENCDLSGSDLEETNLRGANFKGATLRLLLTPLHMSQAIN